MNGGQDNYIQIEFRRAKNYWQMLSEGIYFEQHTYSIKVCSIRYVTVHTFSTMFYFGRPAWKLIFQKPQIYLPFATVWVPDDETNSISTGPSNSTFTGLSLDPILSMPSWNRSLIPEAQTLLSDMKKTLWALGPDPSLFTLAFKSTLTIGFDNWSLVLTKSPLPNCPSSFLPQDRTTPLS